MENLELILGKSWIIPMNISQVTIQKKKNHEHIHYAQCTLHMAVSILTIQVMGSIVMVHGPSLKMKPVRASFSSCSWYEELAMQ